jgi:hypothetical protein
MRSTAVETKAANTNTIARGIIASETAARDAKTNKLRAARLAREASAAAKAPPVPAKRGAKAKGRG